MHKQLLTWKFIYENLQQNKSLILLYVLQSKGSSPGRQGFFMAVNETGEINGSIGGGIMEHKFVEMAKQQLKQSVNQSSVHLQVHDKSVAKNQSGMICSGEQTIFLYHFKEKDVVQVQAIITALQQNNNVTLQLSPDGILFDDSIINKNYSFEIKSDNDFLYKEKIGYQHQLFIIGGGHCSLALSRLMSNMNFYIHLFDDREALNTMEQNNFVHQKTIVDDYNQLNSLIPSGKKNYVVIMTNGYRTDDKAIRALLDKDLAYLGVLGSKNKIKKMFADLSNDGFSDTILNQLYAPVGISIKSQTPEEIAVSIAAEIISVKNKEN